MGKTPIPLVIWVDDGWLTRPEILKLIEMNHRVWSISAALDQHAPLPDLIFSKVAWNWDDSMWDMLETALKAARKRKTGGK